MKWRHTSTSAIAGASVALYISEDATEVVYKAELKDYAPDYATSPHEAKQRLAAKLEQLAQGLRR